MHPGRLPACPVMQKRAVCPTPLHLTRFPALALLLHRLKIASEDDIHKGYLSSKCVVGSLFHPHTSPPDLHLQPTAASPTTPWPALTRTKACHMSTRTRALVCRLLLGRVNMPQTSTTSESNYINHASFADALSYRYGQSLVELDPAAEAKLRRKIDLMIVPTVALLYLFCFIDRANIGMPPLHVIRRAPDVLGTLTRN